MSKRVCTCGVEYLDDRNSLCPVCDAMAMLPQGKGMVAARLKVRQDMQRRVAVGDALPRVQVRDDGAALKRVHLVEVMDFAPTQRKYTPEGYLTVPARIGRTGVQEYRARELGLDGGDKIIRLNRPHEEVFAVDTLASFVSKPISDNHPPDGVNAETWKVHAVGDVGPLRPDGKFMLSEPFTVRDITAIRRVQDGKVQLSCGYDFDLDMTPGTNADGEKYDGTQRNIRGNHVAIVDSARGGSGCRIADSHTKENTMRVRIADATVAGIKIEGFSVTVADDAAGTAAQDGADRHHKALMDCMAAHDELKKSHADLESKLKATELAGGAKEEEGKKKAGDDAKEIERLKALVLTDAQRDAMIEERSKLTADAKKILGDSFEPKDKTNAQVRLAVLENVTAKDGPAKNVVAAVLAGTELAKATESTTKIAFDAILGLGETPTTTTTDANADALARALLGQPAAGGQKPITGHDASGAEIIPSRDDWMGRVRGGETKGASA